MTAKKLIYLVDDHALVRNGLKELIEKLGPYKITGEFDNGRQLVNAYPFHPQPDLIILDVEMPEMNGRATMQWIKENGIKIPVLLLTLNESDALIIGLFRLGVRGYLHKNCSAVTLRRAIEDILTTGYFHDEMMVKALSSDTPSQAVNKFGQQLTEKEYEFLKLACSDQEYTYEVIADLMGVHPRTVNKYRESIFDKLGVKSKTGLVLYAVKNGLLQIH
jgi:two-component system, NarL family, invasion response regulator UvrY